MKAVLIIYVCVALLPSITGDLDSIREQLKKMADQGDVINGIFLPAKDGYLGMGGFSIAYKGTLLDPIKRKKVREVAMKFTPTSDRVAAVREYETYSYLEAINKTDVERYGIPAVYYYGNWDDYILMAITLLDSKFGKRRAEKKLKDIDILILTREFVRISKYIHSRGVYHNDIALSNLMFRKHQAFVIDFNIANKLHKENRDRRRFAKDDWACFLHSICAYIGVEFKKFDHYAMSELLRGCDADFRSMLKDDIEKIDEMKNEGFRRIFVEFAKTTFKNVLDLWADKGKSKPDDHQDTTWFLLHDELYQIISEEIDKLQLPKPVLVSWLSEGEKRAAKEELENNPLPNVSSIKDHFESVNAEYPGVNLNYFAELNEEKTIFKSSENSKSVRSAPLKKQTKRNIFSRTFRGLKSSGKR